MASVFSEHIEQVLHIFAERGLEFHHFICSGVFEFYCPGVECDAVQDGLFDGGLGVFELPGVYEFSAVHIVGDDGVLDPGEVDSYLVGPSGPG